MVVPVKVTAVVSFGLVSLDATHGKSNWWSALRASPGWSGGSSPSVQFADSSAGSTVMERVDAETRKLEVEAGPSRPPPPRRSCPGRAMRYRSPAGGWRSAPAEGLAGMPCEPRRRRRPVRLVDAQVRDAGAERRSRPAPRLPRHRRRLDRHDVIVVVPDQHRMASPLRVAMPSTSRFDPRTPLARMSSRDRRPAAGQGKRVPPGARGTRTRPSPAS